MAGPFKLKGWSGYQASPTRHHEKDKEGNIIEHDVRSERKAAFEDLPGSEYKTIVAKYMRGGKLTPEEEATMARYAEKSKVVTSARKSKEKKDD